MTLRSLFLVLLMVQACVARAEEFLAPELAFRPSARALDARTIVLRVDVAEDYYVYRGRFRFALAGTPARLGQPQFPAGEIHEDPYFGREEVYRGALDVRLPLDSALPGGGTLDLELTLQGCAVKGFCYPPQPYTLHVEMPAAADGPTGATDSVAADLTATAAAGVASGTPTDAEQSPGDESSVIARTLGDAGLLANLLFFFVAGLGLSLTPCVLPMVPILSGIIVGRRQAVSRARGFALSAAYVTGMATTYTAAGVLAGLSGTLLSNLLQTPWVLGSFAAVFVVLSLSMFGFFELQVPAAFQTRVTGGANALRGGLVGVFLMGAVSALVVGPCVAAPLAGALLYIGQTGNAALGGAALFAMALGMGVPLLLVGVSAGALLPRAGAWMESVRKVFGVLLLATAVWLVDPVLPPAVRMLAWALLLIVPAIYLHALDPLPPVASGWRRLWKGCGIVMLVTGTAVLVGALGGNRDLLQPLRAAPAAARQAAEAAAPAFERVRGLADLEARIAGSTVPVMLDVYADWCTACKEMERFTFADPGVRARLDGFRLLQADVTANTDEDRALLRRFGLYGPPGIAFFAPGGAELKALRLVGFRDPESFLAHISRLD